MDKFRVIALCETFDSTNGIDIYNEVNQMTLFRNDCRLLKYIFFIGQQGKRPQTWWNIYNHGFVCDIHWKILYLKFVRFRRQRMSSYEIREELQKTYNLSPVGQTVLAVCKRKHPIWKWMNKKEKFDSHNEMCFCGNEIVDFFQF